MPREIMTHKVNGCNESIQLTVRDEPGSGGACHHYRMVIDGGRRPKPTIQELERILNDPNPPNVDMRPDGRCDVAFFQELFFQNGPIREVGNNGITNEVLLAIVIDRLRCFQSGAFACRENALALTKLEEAVHWLYSRTRERVNRGVEGTHSI